MLNMPKARVRGLKHTRIRIQQRTRGVRGSENEQAGSIYPFHNGNDIPIAVSVETVVLGFIEDIAACSRGIVSVPYTADNSTLSAPWLGVARARF